MPKRSEKRDTAKADYIDRKSKGEKINLREFAKEQGVSYQTLRNWKTVDEWDKALPKKKRGAQPGNKNCAGHRNAAGSHKGAPIGNKNAEKDGAYSRINLDMLTEAEKELMSRVPLKSKEALEHEMQILKLQEYKILKKIAEYEAKPEDELYISSLMDMRIPNKTRGDGATQQMGMYSKDSAFTRIMKLQEALYKFQGRIAKIADSLRAIEENEKRMDMDRERLDILKMRITGSVEIEDNEAEEPRDDT